ncbi:PIEZ1 protein, partial [Pomatostomus ruficeps]|nr:PIEZ1 protein [Pomatostomus ruficeps]
APVPLQLAYQAWVTNTRTVLRQQDQPEQPESPSTDSAAAERSNVLQRALNTLRFLWLLCQALVDGLTQWLDACTREHTDMSHVLSLERCVLAQRLAKGEEMNREFPDELYALPPEEFPQEPSPPGSLAADSQSGASRQVHRNPRGRRWQAGSQEQVTSSGSQEDVADAQQFLALPQQHRRTASELLRSRCVRGQWD